MPDGVVATSSVELMKVTPVAAVPSTVTVAPDTKLVPVSAMIVPPPVQPVFGATRVSVGVEVELV